MIKFVLHGGNSSEINLDNNSFFKEMTVSEKNKLRILLNYFSREESEIAKLSDQDMKRFKKLSVSKNLEFEIAQPDKLSEQLKRADVMYMRGGWTNWLTEKLLLTRNLNKLLDNKVIGGSSAGVYTLTKYYYGNDSKRLGKGLGILPIKAYCHYEPKDMKVINKLASYKERLPLLVLPNYKWVVMYK
jgi:hypothetical protein